jgi:hypothetical protein
LVGERDPQEVVEADRRGRVNVSAAEVVLKGDFDVSPFAEAMALEPAVVSSFPTLM